MLRFLRYFFVISAFFAFLAIAGAAGLFLYGKAQFTAEGPPAAGDSEQTIVLLERGWGLNRIAARLKEAGVITDARIFVLGARVYGAATDLKAGEYAIPSGASMQDVLSLLTSGESILHKLTIAEGLSVAQVIDLVAANDILTGDITVEPEEGMLLPETYLFQRGTTRDELLTQMRDAKETLLYDLWETRAEDLPLESAYDALILASIVEKETGVADERPLVASVFVNRLNRGMPLQSDPTVIYGITQGKPLGRRIRQSELDSSNPYNTYGRRGLPPTPIANPGREALEAVLNPPETDYYYFVADGSGGHAFARTLSEHNRNVAQWRRIQRERGLR